MRSEQARFELQKTERFTLTWHLSSWRYAILLVFIMIAVTAIAPTSAEPQISECPPSWRETDPWFSEKISDFAHYLWAYHRSDIVSELPQFQGEVEQSDTPKDFMALFTNNTDLAIQKLTQYQYGHGLNFSKGMQPDITVQPGWGSKDPFYWSQLLHEMMLNGSTVRGLWDCMRNHYGFDEAFTEASISLAHTLPTWSYQLLTFGMYRNSEVYTVPVPERASELDPAVYGQHPFVIDVPEPGYILLANGHVAFAPGGCPLWALRTYDSSGNVVSGMSTAACFGGYTLLLIVPENVVKEVGLGPIEGTQSFYRILWGGDPALPHLLAGETTDPTYVQRLKGLEVNWAYWQKSYNTLMPALNNYRVAGFNWNFSRLTRVPLDTRFPDRIERQIVWESFPSPLEQLMPAYANPSVTLEGFKTCQDTNTGCVTFNGQDMAQRFALRVTDYLAKYGLFTWAQDSVIRPWLRNYVVNVDSLPNFDITNDGHYVHFQYHDAFKFYNPTATTNAIQLSSPMSMSNPESSPVTIEFTGNIIQAPDPIMSPIMTEQPTNPSDIPPTIPVTAPPIQQTKPATNPVTENMPTVLSSSFGGALLFVQRVSEFAVRVTPLPETRREDSLEEILEPMRRFNWTD